MRKKYDEAWGHYQEMIQLYFRHAKKEKFTVPQTLTLVGFTHRAMARLLKTEERHHELLFTFYIVRRVLTAN